MFDYTALYRQMQDSALEPWLETLPMTVSNLLKNNNHGKLAEWLEILDTLPRIAPDQFELRDEVRVKTAVSAETRQLIETQLRKLHPWRKGPFTIHGIHIDTEWRSDWKWDRLKAHISPLNGRCVLDVGCGNGYHGWRMAGEGARLVIGIDPLLLYVIQYHAIQHFLGPEIPVYVLPLSVEDIPPKLQAFDTVFSMGVLYHRRSPFDHLLQLYDLLHAEGELVLETLVIEGKMGEVLVPEGRYAQMRNVWFIPSTQTLESWLRKIGFQQIKLVDVSPTIAAEQRSTAWMTFHSLVQFLDKDDQSKTVEGHPAPIRAVFTAVKGKSP